MKVCIVGASGKLGKYMVQHALDRGYEVVGVASQGSRWPREAEFWIPLTFGETPPAWVLELDARAYSAIARLAEGRRVSGQRSGRRLGSAAEPAGTRADADRRAQRSTAGGNQDGHGRVSDADGQERERKANLILAGHSPA